MNKCIVIIASLLSLLVFSDAMASDQQDSVNNPTPFRKGRWLTGLSGSISSGSSSLSPTASGVSRNQYAMDFATGRFVKDRFLVGMIFQVSRTNSEEFIKRTAETLFLGPSASYYLSDSEQGSLFVTGSVGFAKFRDETELQQNGTLTRVEIDGNGLGSILRFGYAFVIHDRISFDLGLNLTTYWLSADRLSQPGNTTTKENFRVGDLSFSFGFNVLLDDFFF